MTTLELVERLGPEVDRPRGRRAWRSTRRGWPRSPPTATRRGSTSGSAASSWPACSRCWCGRSTCCASTTRRRPPRRGTRCAAALGPGGVIVEGTCDEWGRRSAWVALDADGPLTLTLATRVVRHRHPVGPRRAAAQGADPPQRAGPAGARVPARVRRGLGGGRRAVHLRAATAVGRGRRGAGRRRAGRWSARPVGGGTARSPCAGRRSRRSEHDPGRSAAGRPQLSALSTDLFPLVRAVAMRL